MPHKDTWEKSPGGMWRPCGELQPIIVPTPALGAEISYTLSGGGVYRFVSLVFSLLTDANVANRNTVLLFTHGGVVFFRSHRNLTQTASDEKFTTYGDSIAFFSGVANDQHFPTPGNFFLPGGTLISTTTASLQTGDRYRNIGLFVEFYPDAGEY